MHHSLHHVSSCDFATIRLIQKLSSKIITIRKQNLNHKGLFFDKFVEALHYYAALFDSLEKS